MAKNDIEHKCNLLNRHELSRSQQYELQRFIERNSHSSETSNIQGDSSSATNRAADRATHGNVSSGRSRKEVKWSDSVSRNIGVHRTQSLPPAKRRELFDNCYNSFDDSRYLKHQYNRQQMPRYGSANNLPGEPMYQYSSSHQISPSHQTYQRQQHDNYNRYETQRARMLHQHEDEGKSRFSGYGDRPGSGVEFAPSRWRGGEIISDPEQLPRSLKPRRLYYSPIGDGVVAADGVELKRQPKDMSPRVTVQHTRTMDRGEPGHDGYNIYTKTATHGESDYGSDLGGSGRDSRLTGGFSPGSDFGGHIGLAHEIGHHDSRNDNFGKTTTIPIKFQSKHSGTNSTLPGYGSTYDSISSRTDNDRTVHPSSYCGASSNAIPLGYNTTSTLHSNYAPKDRFSPRKYPENSSKGKGSFEDVYPTRYTAAHDVYDGLPSCHHSPTYHTQQNTTNFGRMDQYTSERARPQSAGPYGGNDEYNPYGGDYGGKGDGRSSAGSGLYGMSSLDHSKKFDVTKDYLITNPRELIHQYATTTPVSVLEIPETTTRTTTKMSRTTTEETYAPYPPYRGTEESIHPNNFARHLRDEGLTSSQREANLHQHPLVTGDSREMQKISEIRQQTVRSAPAVREVDYLTEKMMYGLQTGHPIPPQY